jgi:hypothetical protein
MHFFNGPQNLLHMESWTPSFSIKVFLNLARQEYTSQRGYIYKSINLIKSPSTKKIEIREKEWYENDRLTQLPYSFTY